MSDNRPTLRQKVARFCAQNPLTHDVFAAYVRYMQKKKYQAFDTCSPDAIPVLKEAFRKKLDGDYYEFGLYKGYLFYTAHEFAKAEGIEDMQFFGFDSFQGLPKVGGIDSGGEFKQGDYAYGIDQVVGHLNTKNMNWKNSFLIKGYFSESLKNPRYPFRKAKIVLIDCDLYESTRDVLTFIYPYLQSGTILMFDDWNCFNADDNFGERRAMKEFLSAHPGISIRELGTFGWHGAFFEVQRKGL